MVLYELLTLRRAWALDPRGEPATAFDVPVRLVHANAVIAIVAPERAGPCMW